MNKRTGISIEDVLRSKSKPTDLLRNFQALVTVLPGAAWKLSVLAVWILLETVLQVSVALLARTLLTESEMFTLYLLGGLGVLVLLVLSVRLRYVFQERVILSWREACVKRLSAHISDGEYEDLASVPMPALREILMTDAPQLTQFYIEAITQTTMTAFWVIAALAVMGWFSPALFIFTLGLLLVLAVFFLWAMRANLRLTGPHFERLADLGQSARDIVEVERILMRRQFGLGTVFIDKFLGNHGVYSEVKLKMGQLRATFRSIMLSLNTIALFGLIVLGGGLVADGVVDAGALLAGLFVLTQLLFACAALGELTPRAAEATTAGKRLLSYWESEEQVETSESSVDVTSLHAEGLTFYYSSSVSKEPVVNQLRLKLERGELASLTAATGAGKSTLGLLLAGILKPRSGSVYLNNQPELGPSSLRPGQILYVGPRPILAEGSLRENLFGGDIDDPLVREILSELGDKAEDVDAPLVGPSGSGFSSGQGQLVQLARAVALSPRVVIFDEATGSLDMPREARVQSALLNWCRDRVTLVISHRQCPWLTEADKQITW